MPRTAVVVPRTTLLAPFVVLALLFGSAATATAEPATRPAGQASAQSFDLSYQNRYPLQIERPLNPAELAAIVASQLTRYFPFDSDCKVLPPVGNRCELYTLPGIPFPGTTNPVRVVDRGADYWTFRSLPGHAEGAGRYITFSFAQTPSGLALDVSAWGPWSFTASITVSTGAARAIWQVFANNLSQAL